MRKHHIAGLVLAMAATLGVAVGAGISSEMPQAAAAQEFRDVPASHPFHDDISWLAGQGITTGWPDGTFRPSESVSRAAYAAFLYRMSGKPSFTPPAVSPFRDVSTKHQFYKEISWLASVKVTTGWPDGTFRPEAKITRDAMAAFMYRYACTPIYVAPAVSPFKDVRTDQPFYREISWMKASGLSTGWADGTYRPAANTERGAIAAFLHRYSTKGFYSEPRCPIPVTAKAVTFADKNGMASDTFTVPNMTGVRYEVNGKTVTPGTHKISDYFAYTDYWVTATVKAYAQSGYLLLGENSWAQKVDGHIHTAPKAVTFTDVDGLAADTFTIPTHKGVQYKVNGKAIAAGTYKIKDYFTYTDYWVTPKVTAHAQKGYTLSGTTSWTKKIDGRTEVMPQTVTFADKNGQKSDTFTVPNVKGVQYTAGTRKVSAGTLAIGSYFTYVDYMADVEVSATPKAGYKFPSGATTAWRARLDGYTTVATKDPSGVDGYGQKADTYTIPQVTGVQYQADGKNVGAGSHAVTTHKADGTTTVKVAATPKAGYKLTGATNWSFAYTAVVSPEAPSFTDPLGTASDSYVIPQNEGVYYTVNGVRVKPGTYTIPMYTNHFRNITVHAYPEKTYIFSTNDVFFFHTFTDGESSIQPTDWSTKDYGPYTTAEAKQRVSVYAQQLHNDIDASSDYAKYTSFEQIYGSKDLIVSRTYGDPEKEINRRFAQRFEQRLTELRSRVGLEPMPLMNLDEIDEKELFAHAVYTQDMQVNGRGHYTDDSHLWDVYYRTYDSGTGKGFDGVMGGIAETLAWNYMTADTTPEEMADRMIGQYIDEWEYLDWSNEALAQAQEQGNAHAQNGHLQALLYDGALSVSSFCYVYDQISTNYYSIITAENYARMWYRFN